MQIRKLLAAMAVGVFAVSVTAMTFADDDKQPAKPSETPKKEVERTVEHQKDKLKEHAQEQAKERPKATDGDDKNKGKGNDKVIAELGKPAPTFTLKDTDGNDVSLATYLNGENIVVLQWYNPDCPVVKMHHQKGTTFKDLNNKYKDKHVVMLAICSSAKGNQGYGVERNKQSKADYGIDYPILMDASGDVGHTYGAKTTPHMFIIAKDGTLAYRGAIDDQKETNYVSKALDELLAGTNVTTTETKPYGCGVKY